MVRELLSGSLSKANIIPEPACGHHVLSYHSPWIECVPQKCTLATLEDECNGTGGGAQGAVFRSPGLRPQEWTHTECKGLRAVSSVSCPLWSSLWSLPPTMDDTALEAKLLTLHSQP
jgi:hypothetical protein